MKLGDVVLYQDARWKVAHFDAGVQIFSLMQPNGTKLEVAPDAEVQVLYNPGEMWPFIAASTFTRGGPVVEVFRGAQKLEVMHDWIPSDFLRSGGSIFFNPNLKLRHGEVLVAVHRNSNCRSRLTVTQAFGTIKKRKRRAGRKSQPKEVTVYDQLMGPDLFDDE